MIDSNRPNRRTEIDKIFTKTKASMQQAALIRGGEGVALYVDVYTGKTLRGGDPYDYEHLRSSEAVHTYYKSVLTDEQIALVVNCSENVAVTLRTINQSKGKRKMEDWLSGGFWWWSVFSIITIVAYVVLWKPLLWVIGIFQLLGGAGQ